MCRAYYVSVFYYFFPIIMLVMSSLLGVVKQTYKYEFDEYVKENCQSH